MAETGSLHIVTSHQAPSVSDRQKKGPVKTASVPAGSNSFSQMQKRAAGHDAESEEAARINHLLETGKQMLVDLKGVTPKDKLQFITDKTDKNGQPVLVFRITNAKGIIRDVELSQLQKRHEQEKKSNYSELADKKERIEYLIARNCGCPVERTGYQIKQSGDFRPELTVIYAGGTEINFRDFEKMMNDEKPGMGEQIKNFQKLYGKVKGIEYYINHETRFGKSAHAAFSQRARKQELEKAIIDTKKAQADTTGNLFKKLEVKYRQVAATVKRPVSYLGAVAQSATSVITYDWNPLRPVLGKVWTHEFKRGISLRELAGRLEEKLMLDPVTGIGVRSGAIREGKIREAAFGGFDWAFKMNVLPQMLSQLPVINGLNLNPGEIWSIMRSTNMLKSGVGSIRQFAETLKHAKTPAERAKLVTSALVSAPVFLFAEKLAGQGLVNPVLMADIGLMRMVGVMQNYLGERGLVTSKHLRVLEAVETGITGAFAFDSGISLGKRAESYANTGSFDPLARISNEAELVKLADAHPEYLTGKGGGVFGEWERFENELLGMPEPGMRTFTFKNDMGEPVHYSIHPGDNDAAILVRSTGGILERYSGGNWIRLTEEVTPEPEIPVIPDANIRPDNKTLISDSGNVREVAFTPEKESPVSFHDYIYFAGSDPNRFAFRMDLGVDAAGKVESLDAKVDRLFAGKFDDRSEPGLIEKLKTGEGVKTLTPEELVKVSGANRVYEAQIYDGLITKLINRAKADGFDPYTPAVRTRFADFIRQGAVDGQTFEGEVADFNQLYAYLYQGAGSAAPRDVEVNFKINPGSSFSVDLSNTLKDTVAASGYSLRSTGIFDSAGKYLDQAALFKSTKEGLTQIPWGDKRLDKVFAGEEFVVRFKNMPVTTESNVALPSIIKLGESDQATFESASPAASPDRPVIDPVTAWKDKPLHDAKGDIYLGKVTAENWTPSHVITERFKDTWDKPFGHLSVLLQPGETAKNNLSVSVMRGGVEVARYSNYKEISVRTGDELVLHDPLYLKNPESSALRDINRVEAVNPPPANPPAAPVTPTAPTVPATPPQPVSPDRPNSDDGSSWIPVKGFLEDGKFDLANPPAGPIRDINNEIYAGVITAGGSISVAMDTQFGKSVWFSTIKPLYENKDVSGVDVYVISRGGTIRTFTGPVDQSYVYAGDRIIIKDPNHKIEMAKNYTDIEAELIKEREANRQSPVPTNPEIEQESQAFINDIQKIIDNNMQNENSRKIGILIYDVKTGKNAGFLPDSNHYPESVIDITAAMMILKYSETGKISMDNRAKFAVREGGYIPTIKEILYDGIVNNSKQAINELKAEIIGKDTATLSLNEDYQKLVQSEFHTAAGITENGLYSASDLMQIFKALENGNYLNPQDKNYLEDLMIQGSREGVATSSVGVYDGVKVIERSTTDFEAESPYHYSNTMVKITTKEGRSLLAVILKSDESPQTSNVNKLLNDIILKYDSTLDSKNHLLNQVGYQLNIDSGVQNDYVSHFLYPEMNENGTPKLNPELPEFFADSYIVDPKDAINHVTAYPDGTVELSLKNSAGKNFLYSLDQSGNIIRSIDSSKIAGGNAVLLDLRDFSKAGAVPFSPGEFSGSSAKTEVEIGTLLTGGYPVNTESGRERYIKSIQEGNTDPYDYLIFPTIDGKNILAYVRPVTDRNDGAVPGKLKVGIVSSGFGYPDRNQQQLLSDFVTRISDAGDTLGNISDVIFKDSKGNAVSLNKNGIVPDKWYTSISPDLKTAINAGASRIGRTDSLLPGLDFAPITELENGEFPRLSTLESHRIDDIFNELRNELKDVNSTLGKSLEMLPATQFEKNLITRNLEITGLTQNPGEVKFSTLDLFAAAGISKSDLSQNGVTYMGSVWIPEISKMDRVSLSKQLGIEPDLLVLKSVGDSNTYLAGRKMTEDPDEIKSTYDVKTHNLVYVISDGDNQKIVTELKSGDNLLSVQTLLSPLEKAMPFEKLVPLSKGENMAVQWLDSGEYLVGRELLGGKTNDTVQADLYVDPVSLRVYGLKDGNLYSVQGRHVSYDEYAKLKNIDTSDINYTQKVFNERMLDTVFTWTKSGEGIFHREGNFIKETDSQSGHVSTYQIFQNENGNYRFDSQMRLLYTDSSGKNAYYFDKLSNKFVQSDMDKFITGDVRLSGFKEVVAKAGDIDAPLNYKGLPVYTKDELLYVLSPEGMVTIGSIYSKGNLDLYAEQETGKLNRKFGITESEVWKETKTYDSLYSVNEKVMHSAALKNDHLIETSKGLFDVGTGDYLNIQMTAGGQMMVDKSSGATVFISQIDSDKRYVFGSDGIFKQFSGELVSVNDFIKSKGLNEEIYYQGNFMGRNFNPTPLLYRLNELPVYSDSKNYYVVDVTGVRMIGLNNEEYGDTGLLGYKTSSGFHTLHGTYYEDPLDSLGRAIINGNNDTRGENLKIEPIRTTLGSSNYVPLEQMPEFIVNAIISQEDKKFFQRDDGDAVPMSVSDYTQAVISQTGLISQRGGSNIVQQLARNLALDTEARQERSASRKLSDVEMANEIIKNYSQKEILEAYANSINYYGRGIVEGARNVFGKDISQLSKAESMLLSIIPKNPAVVNYLFNYQPDNKDFPVDPAVMAKQWAETACGTTRRMGENGFISVSDREQIWSDIYKKVFPDGSVSDIGYLIDKGYVKADKADQLLKIASEYQNLSWKERDQAQYVDFLRYVSIRNPDLMKPEAMDNYFKDKAWQPKFGSEISLTDTSNRIVSKSGIYDSDYLNDPRSVGKIAQNVAVAGDGSIKVSQMPFYYEALSRRATDQDLNLPVVQLLDNGKRIVKDENDKYWTISETGGVKTIEATPLTTVTSGSYSDSNTVVRDFGGNLFTVSHEGLQKMSSSVYERNDSDTVVQLSDVYTRPGVIETLGVNADKLMTDVSGDNYYLKDNTGKSVSYFGKAFELEPGVETVVKIPEIEYPRRTNRSEDLAWTSVANILSISRHTNYLDNDLINDVSQKMISHGLTPKTSHDVTSLLSDLLPEGKDPNTSVVKVGGDVYINPQAVHTALEKIGEKTTVLELNQGRNNEGAEVLKSALKQAAATGKQSLVWLNYSRTIDVIKDGSGTASKYFDVSKSENPVTVLNVIEKEGKTYVIYHDPHGINPVAISWDRFIQYAAPEYASHYKALIMGDAAIPPIARDLAYDYTKPSNQLEIALSDQKNKFIYKDGRSDVEQMMTVNSKMQAMVADKARELMPSGATAFYGVAMDAKGNVLFNVAIDKDGKPLPFTSTSTDAITPGSTMKTLTSLYLLNDGLDPNQQKSAGDKLLDAYGNTLILNHTVDANGRYVAGYMADKNMNLMTAYATSNNPYFSGRIYEKNDASAYDRYLQNIGIGGSRYDIPGLPNSAGFLGTSEWAKANGLDPSNFYHALKAIGEGEVRLTTTEMLPVLYAIANNGKMIAPNIVRGQEATQIGALPNAQKDLDVMKKAMSATVTMNNGYSSHGTAFTEFVYEKQFQVYGKTGTAELAGNDNPHGLFQGWVENPVTHEQVFFSFVYKNGGSLTSNPTLPLTHKVFSEYFKNPEAYRAQTELPAITVNAPVQNPPAGPSGSPDTAPPQSPAAAPPEAVQPAAPGDYVVGRDVGSMDILKKSVANWNPETQKNAPIIDFSMTLEKIINEYQKDLADRKIKDTKGNVVDKNNGEVFVAEINRRLGETQYKNLKNNANFQGVLNTTKYLSERNPDQEMQCLNYVMLLSASNLTGAPRFPYVDGNALEMFNLLNPLRDGAEGIATMQNQKGEVKQYGTGGNVYHYSDPAEYRVGDEFYINYGSEAHVGVVLGRSVSADGKPLLLVTDSNRNSDKPQTVADGLVRTKWLTYDQFRTQYKIQPNNVLIVRPYNSKELN